MRIGSAVARYPLHLVTLALALAASVCSLGDSTWYLVSTGSHPHTQEFLAIAFSDANHGWGITPSALLETTDGGKTWSTRLDDETKTFYSLQFPTPSTGFIVGVQRKSEGRAALILRTSDGGRTWQESAFNGSSTNQTSPLYLASVSFCNPQVGWAAGSNLIVRTIDGGHTWEERRGGNSEEMLIGVACASAERAHAVGQGGLILQTRDAGKTWVRQDSGTKLNLARVRFFETEGWIVGGMAENSLVLRSRDGGETWHSVQIKTSEPLFDAYMREGKGWLVGGGGMILHTNDGGESWQQQKSPTNNDLTTLFFLNPHQGWAGGDKRTLLRFSD